MRPFFSVVIPTRDRFDRLVTCLEALTRQDYDWKKFEVIVVDDGSRTPVAIDQRFADRLNLTILRQFPGAGPSIARNLGARSARGEFIAFTDDDCSPATDWLSRLAQRFIVTPIQLIGGRVINALVDNPYSTAAHVVLDVVYQYYDPAEGRPHFFPTSNFALPAQSFAEIGGFDESWPLAAAEDRELCYRWIKCGYVMVHAPEAIVYHAHCLTISSYCALHYKYGRGAYHYHQLRAGGAGQGGLKPDWAFYWHCFRYPWRRFSASKAVVQTALLGLWQICNAAGYFRQVLHGQVSTEKVTEPNGTNA